MSKFTDEWGAFTAVPNTFIEQSQNLSGSARWLFVLLRFRTHQQRECAWPSYDQLRSLTGWGAATITKAIKELEEHGWLERRKRFGASAVYVLRRPSTSETEELANAEINGPSTSETEELENTELNASSSVSAVLQKLKHSSSETEAQFFRNERTASLHDQEELSRKNRTRREGARAPHPPKPSPPKKSSSGPGKKSGVKAKPKEPVPPAIEWLRELTGRYPKKDLWPPLVAHCDAADFDRDRARQCWEEWALRGHNPMNYRGWLFDWYLGGIPEQGAKNNGKSANRKTAGENLRESIEWTLS